MTHEEWSSPDMIKPLAIFAALVVTLLWAILTWSGGDKPSIPDTRASVRTAPTVMAGKTYRVSNEGPYMRDRDSVSQAITGSIPPDASRTVWIKADERVMATGGRHPQWMAFVEVRLKDKPKTLFWIREDTLDEVR